MTPFEKFCEERGYNINGEFICTDKSRVGTFSAGDRLKIYDDDRTNNPKFIDIKTGRTDWYCFSLEGAGELVQEITQTFPEPPFKLSCGDKPEVRQWLKDNGWVEYPTCLEEYNLLLVKENKRIDSWDNSQGYDLSGAPEITPIIAEVPVTTTEMKVVGYSVNENNQKESLQDLQEKLKKEQEKLLQASEEIAKITTQINELGE